MQAFAVICRSAREQVVEELKTNAEHAVSHYSNIVKPTEDDVKEMEEAMEMTNNCLQNLVHFNRWSPFFHENIGIFGGGSVQLAMKNVETSWRNGDQTQLAGVFRNATNSCDYSDQMEYSLAVGFRASILPEPYSGNWSEDEGRLQNLQLIVKTVQGNYHIAQHIFDGLR